MDNNIMPAFCQPLSIPTKANIRFYTPLQKCAHTTMSKTTTTPTNPQTLSKISRRSLLTLISLSTCSNLFPDMFPLPAYSASSTAENEFLLPPLPYKYDSLQPYISEQIMRFHHDAHFATYIKNLNNALKATPSLSKILGDDDALRLLLAELDKSVSDPSTRKLIRNNGGGYLNHKYFFNQMVPGGKSLGKQTPLAQQIDKQFGSFDEFEQTFLKAANTLFGSGFVWLLKDKKTGQLSIKSFPNQDNPALEGNQAVPLLACDCWEHSWYYQYGPKKADYFNNWWKVIDWGFISDSYV